MEESKYLLLTQRKMWVFILFICFIFILSGGANTGFSKFFMALPFMLLAILISTKVLKKNIYKKLTFILILFSIIFNITLTKNPLAFPILDKGSIEIMSNGFHITFSDGSGGFYDEKLTANSYDNVTYKELKKGEKYKVTGIKITHPDFSTKVYLQTAIGQFSQSNYNITLNKEAHATWVKNLGFLMNWPILFMLYAPLGGLILLVLLVLFQLGINRLPKS